MKKIIKFYMILFLFLGGKDIIMGASFINFSNLEERSGIFYLKETKEMYTGYVKAFNLTM